MILVLLQRTWDYTDAELLMPISMLNQASEVSSDNITRDIESSICIDQWWFAEKKNNTIYILYNTDSYTETIGGKITAQRTTTTTCDSVTDYSLQLVCVSIWKHEGHQCCRHVQPEHGNWLATMLILRWATMQPPTSLHCNRLVSLL